MIHLIRKHDQNAEIYVMSSHWKENELFYKEYDVHSVPAVWSLNQNESSLKRYFNGFKNIWLFNKYKERKFNPLQSSRYYF